MSEKCEQKQDVAGQDLPPVWDLSDLYAGVDDPALSRDLDDFASRAAAFEKKWRGRVLALDLSASALCEALREYMDIWELAYKPDAYADLLFAADTAKPQHGALVQKVSEAVSSASVHLIFFDLELGQISDEVWSRLRQEDELAEFVHFVDQQKAAARHNLSEPEERVLEETSSCRGQAFSRLYTELVSRLRYPMPMQVEGEDGVVREEIKELSQSELLALSYEPDREVRRQAALSLNRVLEQNAHPIHFCYNALILEKITMDRLRGFSRPEASRNLSNELDDVAVDTMIGVVVRNYDIVERYYNLKRRILCLDKLYHYDRYAPLNADSSSFSFAQARETVLASFAAFSPEFAQRASLFFEKHWIDARLNDTKRGGAFCCGITPKIHPYVLLNYTGRARDVMTLAHELGHGIHDLLASKQNLLNYSPVLPLAETASTFAEQLVFDKLSKDAPNTTARLGLLAEKLEDTFATVFRQTAMYRFEQKVFNARLDQGELSVEQMNAFWQECLQEMFGKSLELGPDHANTWLYVPHFVHTPFYVYAYAFGELLVLSLYARYLQEGQPFIARYVDLLSAGGSLSPKDLLAKLDIDIADPAFWQGGCDIIAKRVDWAEELARQECEENGDTWDDDEVDASAGWGDGDDDGWDGFGEDEECEPQDY